MTAAIAYLRSPLAVRARCETILEAGLAGALAHYAIDLRALPKVIDAVIARLPRETLLPERFSPEALVDLTMLRVLADDEEACTNAFRMGRFSSDPSDPLRADASGLREVEAVPGVDARLFRALGGAISIAPRTFRFGRPAGLLDALRANGSAITAPALLQLLLEGLAPIWQSHVCVGDVSLGDVAHHPAAGGTGPTAGLVPFHRVAQRLAYALFEPLERAGIAIQQPGALTALPAYRANGLLVSLGVLTPKTDVNEEAITEWRALAVALCDRIAADVEKTTELPLANVLAVIADRTSL